MTVSVSSSSKYEFHSLKELPQGTLVSAACCDHCLFQLLFFFFQLSQWRDCFQFTGFTWNLYCSAVNYHKLSCERVKTTFFHPFIGHEHFVNHIELLSVYSLYSISLFFFFFFKQCVLEVGFSENHSCKMKLSCLLWAQILFFDCHALSLLCRWAAARCTPAPQMSWLMKTSIRRTPSWLMMVSRDFVPLRTAAQSGVSSMGRRLHTSTAGDLA